MNQVEEKPVDSINEGFVCINNDDVSVIDESERLYELDELFTRVPVVAVPIKEQAKKALRRIESILYSAPAFIEFVKSTIPDYAVQAILTDDQKKALASGALKLMTKKDGTLMANLINPKTKKIVSTVSLKSVSSTPGLSQALTDYATQMQMAQIAEQIQMVQLAIEEVRKGQEYDRLAMAYSCQQKLLQALSIVNPELKAAALLRITADAEDSRNLLMLSQKANVEFIREQPESFWGKIFSGATPEKIGSRMEEIRDSLSAVNMVSLTEAIAYQEMGEPETARQSLLYYAEYLQKTYLEKEGFIERLDLIDPSPENYWSRTLPEIKKKIISLPCVDKKGLIEDGKDETEGLQE